MDNELNLVGQLKALLREVVRETVLEAVREGMREAGNGAPHGGGAGGDDDSDLLTAVQVAALLKCPRQSVYALRREGKLKAVKLGGVNGKAVRFQRSEVQSLIAESTERSWRAGIDT
jgi:excisionase family DNA binding protein